MAKFKVGDKVTDGNSVFQITKVNPDDYGWKLVKGDGKDAFGKSISAGGMISWADQKMRKAANAVTSKNPVVANAIKAKNDAQNDIEAFIEDYGEGGTTADTIRYEYKRLVGPHENNKSLAHLVSRAKKAMASGIRRAFNPVPEGTYKGLRFQGGGIQMPEGEPVDIEVYAGSKYLGVYDAMNNPGRTPEEKIAIKEYVKKAGVGSRYIHNSATSKNAVDPLDALNSAETKMREAIGELGKVTDPDLRPLASRIATKLKAVQGELRRELAV